VGDQLRVHFRDLGRFHRPLCVVRRAVVEVRFHHQIGVRLDPQKLTALGMPGPKVDRWRERAKCFRLVSRRPGRQVTA
jgi:hypothetical protein